MASFSDQAGSSSAYNFIDALGVNISGIGLNNKLGFWSGTSMSTPLVAAEAAVLESTHSGLSAAQIVQDIMQTAQTLDFSSSTSATAVAAHSIVQAHTAHAFAAEAMTSLDTGSLATEFIDPALLHRYG